MKSIKFKQLIFISIIIVLILTGCQAAPTQPPVPTNTPISPTKTPEIPTANPVPAIIQASNRPILIQGFSIVIKYNGFIDVGYNPFGGKSNMAMQFDISEESGKLNEIIPLGVLITDNEGKGINTAFQESGTGVNGKTTLVYNILTTKPSGNYFLRFPTGEMIDLTPLIK